MDLKDWYRGSLLGLAAGDALGTAVEFKAPGSFTPIDDMVGGGPFHLAPGQWTDDTSMALCLAESLVECGGFDAADQMTRYVRWWREGHLSSTGTCFDIGNTTSSALRQFERTGEPFSGSTDERSAGKGSIMRLAPVPLCFGGDARAAIERAGESSRTTHGARDTWWIAWRRRYGPLPRARPTARGPCWREGVRARIAQLRHQSEDANKPSPRAPAQCAMVRGWK